VATDSDSVSVHRTLSGSTPDVITITQAFDRIRVTNRTDGATLWAQPGNLPSLTAAAKGSSYIPPGGWVEFDYASQGVVSVVGTSNDYSVEGLTRAEDRYQA
jgi:hypothetical protein